MSRRVLILFCVLSRAQPVCSLAEGSANEDLSLPTRSPCKDTRTPPCRFHPWQEWVSSPDDPLHKTRTRQAFPVPCHCAKGSSCKTQQTVYTEPRGPSLGRWPCLSRPSSSFSKGGRVLDCSDEGLESLNELTRKGSQGFLARAPDVLSTESFGEPGKNIKHSVRDTGCVPGSLVTPETFVPWAVFHEPRARFVHANGTVTVVTGSIACPSPQSQYSFCPPRERGLDILNWQDGFGFRGFTGDGWDYPTVFALAGSSFVRGDKRTVPFGLYPFDSNTCDVRNRSTGLGCMPGAPGEYLHQTALQNQLYWNIGWSKDDAMATGYNSYGVKLWWGWSEVPLPREFDHPSVWDALVLKLPAGADNLWSLTTKALEHLPNVLDAFLDLERDPETGGWRNLESLAAETAEGEGEGGAESGLFLGKPLVLLNELADENGNFRRHFFCQDFDFVWADGSGRGALRTASGRRKGARGGEKGEGNAHCRLCDERRGGAEKFEMCLKGLTKFQRSLQSEKGDPRLLLLFQSNTG
uniref:Uncharacterized protein n=1 Tax=Chromera velia CCMP2878 TaxID=1169474 RepID=A0A0G4H903_9ALVE|eukprot:Cvel_5933.t1-p1 / transcript=Cvel_5933.t1 / gene=Cvel_5933 / organism=Chromera_velia_CCMP2878 / gene_product=hypothetical protein / transcript_product=hypothetical protein / location=Cvel_scaffold284:2275-6040(+) / protein_length=523 / sequence_SO=supercontig / SO=protein_coding / is_pseudo=false